MTEIDINVAAYHLPILLIKDSDSELKFVGTLSSVTFTTTTTTKPFIPM
jgi:hypothetical protein